MSTVTRYDIIEIGATVDPVTGWIRDKPVVTRSGVFNYKDKAGKTIREYRSPEEVFKADSLVTLAGIPITDGHNGIITADNAKGILGAVMGPGAQDENNVIADIIIHDTKKLGNRKELSLGYHADILETPGKTPDGEEYDTVQTNVRYNHLAVVNRGRAGNARLRLDSNDDATSFDVDTHEQDEIKSIRLDDVEYRFDAVIDYAAAQDLARAIVKLTDEHRERRSRYMALEQEKVSLRGQVAEAARILQAAVLDAKAETRARVALEEVAKKHKVNFDENTTDRELREQVVLKLKGPSMKFDDKSDDYVQSAFDLAISNADDKNQKLLDQRKQMQKPPTGDNTMISGAAAARAKWIQEIRARNN